MARPLRLEFPGALYHVTARGDRREAIYFDEDDRQRWLELLGVVCERFNWVCHAWCQMTNHYHLLVETPEVNLPAGMRQLNGVYTQAINRRHGRVGHVFQGRYKAILVEKESYLLELARYIVLNPVRAGVVRDVSEWAWSSYHATIGTAGSPKWLATDWLLSQFAGDRGEAIRQYQAFVRDGTGRSSPWDELTAQVFLGSEAFVERMQDELKGRSLEEVPRAQQRPRAEPLETYAADSDRRRGMARAYLSGNYTMKAIAEHFGVHYATVSRAVHRYEDC
jgi:REP element-mobilizing transposase RayT